MEEIRIDCYNQTAEELALAKKQAQLMFKLNHTMPMTEEYDALVHEIFPEMGENSRINTPLTAVRPHKVKIGKNVVIMNGCLMMSAGGITIEDEALIAANVQLISNNHDLEHRNIITCKPVRICRKAWIGAGATKKHHVDGMVNAVDLHLTSEEIAYLDECYVPHPLVGVMAQNTPSAVNRQQVWTRSNNILK
ncbi:hypothetical protein AB9N12_04220 [Bacteroides sp. AN502(2024)]|uniref:acyltransferase n=1 Tax=Bacteroides sp. AN502(2024) TaxID=3160599 RepID=UPI003512236C